MAKNYFSGTGTKHVNQCYHYCREVHGEDKLIELFFVRTNDNEADIMTKNPTRLGHLKHSPKCQRDRQLRRGGLRHCLK